MRLLLDTHVWVWACEAPEKLGPRTRACLENLRNDRFVLPISTVEVARLLAGGELVFAIPLLQWVERSLADLRAETLELTHGIAAEAYALPEPFHRDPADRLLAAAARVAGATLVTADARLLAYRHVDRHDARR